MSESQDNTLGIFCPLFKGEKFIRNYLENILEQTIFSKVNFYILDCASPENEYEIIIDYTSKQVFVIGKFNCFVSLVSSLLALLRTTPPPE